ncbi:hypothetical protein SEQ01_09300 [Streptococcus equinus]|nr:hypothetical protein SEQ01_09300 [Streptococcus equinus]
MIEEIPHCFPASKKEPLAMPVVLFIILTQNYFIVGKRNLNLCSFSLIHEAHYNGHILNSTNLILH